MSRGMFDKGGGHKGSGRKGRWAWFPAEVYAHHLAAQRGTSLARRRALATPATVVRPGRCAVAESSAAFGRSSPDHSYTPERSHAGC